MYYLYKIYYLSQIKVETMKSSKKSKKVKNPSLKIVPKSSSNDLKDWYSKIAANRGKKWKASLVKGRREAMLKPSNLRIARLSRNLEQSDMIPELKISKSSYCAIERGRQAVKLDKAKIISLIVKKPLLELFEKHRSLPHKYVAILRNL